MSLGFGFGIGIGDVIAAGKLARSIYLNCFTEAQAAHVKYAELRQYIQSLEHGLKLLEDVIQKAVSEYDKISRRPWHSHSQSSSHVMAVLPDITGNFQKTLEDCEKVLKSHQRLQTGRSRFFDNLGFWSTGAGSDIENLRSRLQFHVTKINLVTKPFEVKLLSEIHRDVRETRAGVELLIGIATNGINIEQARAGVDTTLQSLKIPAGIVSRFEEALQTGAPVSYMATSDMPVKEGFDALVYSFSTSTVEFRSVPRLGQNVPEGSQYLNLLKSIWISNQLRQSSHFTMVGSDSLWRDYLKDLKEDITREVGRFDNRELIRPPSEAYATLPASSFHIWVDEKPLSQGPELAEQGPLEDKILELPIALESHLSNRTASLAVLRRSEDEYRLVTTIKQTDNPLFHSESGEPINIDTARLIPAYATDIGSFTASQNIAICNERGQFPQWYTLKIFDDLCALQQALTGYRIHHLMGSVSWMTDGGHSGQGGLQLWQYKPLRSKQGASESQNPTNRTSLAGSPPNRGGFPPPSPTPNAGLHTAMKAEHGCTGSRSLAPPADTLGLTAVRTMSVAQSSRTRTNGDGRSISLSGATFVSNNSVQPRSGGFEIMKPELPTLMFFTMIGERRAFVQLLLEECIFVNPRACSCRTPLKTCRKVVFESKKRNFQLQKLVASEDANDIFSWDLSVFRHPRTRSQAKLDALRSIDRVKTLTLKFETEIAKDEFLKELQELEDWRTFEHNEYEEARREARRRGHRAS